MTPRSLANSYQVFFWKNSFAPMFSDILLSSKLWSSYQTIMRQISDVSNFCVHRSENHKYGVSNNNGRRRLSRNHQRRGRYFKATVEEATLNNKLPRPSLKDWSSSWSLQLVKAREYKADLTLRWLMSYIYGAPILDVSRSHTMTQHSR